MGLLYETFGQDILNDGVVALFIVNGSSRVSPHRLTEPSRGDLRLTSRRIMIAVW